MALESAQILVNYRNKFAKALLIAAFAQYQGFGRQSRKTDVRAWREVVIHLKIGFSWILARFCTLQTTFTL